MAAARRAGAARSVTAADPTGEHPCRRAVAFSGRPAGRHGARARGGHGRRRARCGWRGGRPCRPSARSATSCIITSAHSWFWWEMGSSARRTRGRTIGGAGQRGALLLAEGDLAREPAARWSSPRRSSRSSRSSGGSVHPAAGSGSATFSSTVSSSSRPSDWGRRATSVHGWRRGGRDARAPRPCRRRVPRARRRW